MKNHSIPRPAPGRLSTTVLWPVQIVRGLRLLTAATSLAFALAAGLAPAANLLVNPGFEDNSGHAVPIGWTRFAPTNTQPFGNYWIEGNFPAHSGTLCWKQWGASYVGGRSNVAGIYQEFSSAHGSVYEAGGWFHTRSNDLLGSNCRTWLEVLFYGASTNLLAVYKSPDFTAADGADTWQWFPVTQACDLALPMPSGDPQFTLYSVTGTVSQILAPPGTVTVRYRYAYLQANTAGGSAFLDDALLNQVSGPLPPVITDVLPLNMIFADPNEGLTFKATSPSGFTINTSGIKLVVNGIDVSSALTVAGIASSKTVGYFGLQSNQTYNATITVTDASGFSASTTSFFQTTWAGLAPVVYLWEAEDYDFEGGKYINQPELCSAAGNPNCYFGKAGIEGVDFHGGSGGATRLYRPDDPIPTGVAGDMLRKSLVTAGRLDYRIDPFMGGEWLNYTRDWPAGTYWVSARLATGEGLSGTITLSQVNPDSSTTDLGTFTIESGQGWTAYENVLLRDTNGNITTVTLNGKATLRVTSGGNLLPNFFTLSAGQLDLPIVSDLYPTGKHPFEHTNQLSFTVRTIGATFPAGGIKMLLNGSDVSSQLVITGPDAQKTVVYPGLKTDAIQSALITITNSLGTGIAITNHFDTFSEANFMVEAEDYDFDGAQYVTDWYPGAYAPYNAVTNVDFHHTSIDGEQYLYRFSGIPHEIARDYLRGLFVLWGGTDYHLAWYGENDWANYTRVYPTNSFYAYLRSGGFGPCTLILDEVTSGAGTENQTTRRLGEWNFTGRDNQTHQWVPLTAAGASAPAAIDLGGETTLRVTTPSGNCHPSYFMLVPAPGITLTASRSANGVAIAFPTRPGIVYRVLQRADLAAGDWTLLQTVQGDGNAAVVEGSSGARGFYKVVAP